MSVNKLGGFQFVTFHHPHDDGAPPLLPSMMGDLVQRPGVDGSSVMKLGFKGQPFQMRSGVDVLTFAAGNSLQKEYTDSVNVEPLILIWGGVNYKTNFQAIYLPIRVDPIRIRRVLACTGGINGTAGQAWVEALWTLLPLRS